MSYIFYSTITVIAIIYLYRYIDTTKKKLNAKVSDTLKEDYKDL
jgi:hypothetical protein